MSLEILEGYQLWKLFQKINLQGTNKLIVLGMSAGELTEEPSTTGCQISQDIVC